jgi:hypothetical protein
VGEELLRRPGTRTIDFLVALNRAVNADVGYSLRMEPGVQTPDFTLRTGNRLVSRLGVAAGVDPAPAGLGARFVSGYLVQLTSDVEALDGPSGPAADFTDLHAWARCTSRARLDRALTRRRGCSPARAHPAVGDASSRVGRPDHRRDRTVRDHIGLLQRRHPSSRGSRVTLPYTEAAWGAICALGARVDERLAAGDVRLTVGGEPTFVSIDNQVDPEWTTDADGPYKRERASALAARLKKLWAPQGLVQRSQGKWYPGEPLPRWQIGLFWRIDGQPLWIDQALLADPWQADGEPPALAHDVGGQVLNAVADGPRAAGFAGAAGLRGRAGRLAGAVRQPEGEPVAARRRSGGRRADARAALMSRLEEPVTEPAAYVLPLHRRDDDSGWASADWKLRRGRIVLLEGDSPAGLRLPLNSISWHPPPPSITPTR